MLPMSICSIRPTLPPPLPPTHLRLSGLALSAGFALAGALVAGLSQPRQQGPPCSTCNGLGYIECICQRWSTGVTRSAGCDSCQGSLRTRCPNCRGGGTGIPSMVPIPVRIRDGFLGLVGVVLGRRTIRRGRVQTLIARGVSVRHGRRCMGCAMACG